MPRRRGKLLAIACLLLAGPGGSAEAETEPACSPTLFVQARTFPAGVRPRAVLAADFDNDGTLDLATLADGVAVLRGNGDGSFQLPLMAPGLIADSFAAGKFDADSNEDLVLAANGGAQFAHGNGNGSFAAPVSLAVSGANLAVISAADVDGNGKLDIVAISGGFASQGKLVVLLGNGDGTFSAPKITTLSAPVSTFVIADFDGDGKADVALTEQGGNSVFVLLGNGGGDFAPTTTLLIGAALGAISAADFDGDGHADLVVVFGSQLAFARGLGGGTFGAALVYPAGAQPGAIVVGNFDGDGRPDVAVADSSASYFGPVPGALHVFLASGSGLAPSGHNYLVPGAAPLGIAAGDWDGDGRIDLATSSYGEDSVSVLLSLGGARFEGVERIGTAGSPSAVSADFDGDGRPDVALGTAFLQVALANGDGTFRRVGGGSLFYDATALRVADFNEDGKPDLVAVVYQYQEVSVLLGNGDGTFQARNDIVAALAAAAAAADWDEDGHEDLLIGRFNGISVLHGNGDGTFGDRSEIDLDFSINDVLAIDWNEDGHLDWVGVGGEGVVAGFGHGDGTFDPPVVLVPFVSPNSIVSADFDGDGLPDLLVTGVAPGVVEVVSGDGQGGVRDDVQIAVGWDAVGATVGDFDGDGKLDFATANPGANNLSVLRGLGGGSFGSPTPFSVGGSPDQVLSGDFSGRGLVDLLSVNPGDSSLSLLRNGHLGVSSPAPRIVCGGVEATFSVTASGFGAVHYQWRKNGLPMSDGGNVTGAASAVLNLAPTTAADAGSYDVVVTDSCTSATSAAAALTVAAKPATPPITAPLSVPPGAAGRTASVPAVAGHGYQWSLTGGSITGGQGTHAITFTAGPAGTTMSLGVVESLSAGCSSDPAQAKVQVDFLDVSPSHLFHDAIVSIARAGITSGCGAGRYCPELPVSRSSMSVFILRGEHGAAYVPPDATGTVFSDVSTSTFLAKWIEQFGNEGISTGCGGGNFCPGDAVNRASMAVFLLRGKYGSSYDPPPATGTVFADVQVDTFLAKWMEKLKLDGITSGCGGGNYCPNGTVSRGEMAALVKKTFGL